MLADLHILLILCLQKWSNTYYSLLLIIGLIEVRYILYH